nr:hypothetical protein CFP56_26128 [Quercus suber]
MNNRLMASMGHLMLRCSSHYGRIFGGLQVLNKVKHLAWKACKDSLPTKTNLVRRKVITEDCCDACNRDPNLFVAMLWTIWNRRNNLRLGKSAIPLGQVITFAQDRILETSTCNVGVQRLR